MFEEKNYPPVNHRSHTICIRERKKEKRKQKQTKKILAAW